MSLVKTYDIEDRTDCQLHKVGMVVPTKSDCYLEFKNKMKYDNSGIKAEFVQQINKLLKENSVHI